MIPRVGYDNHVAMLLHFTLSLKREYYKNGMATGSCVFDTICNKLCMKYEESSNSFRQKKRVPKG